MALNKLTTNHITDNTIKSAKIADGAITDAKISESTTISLSKTTATGTQPTISSLSISQKSPSVAANVTITGTNFVSIPEVKFINQSTGARITASTVTYTSSTSLTVSFPAGQSIASYKVSVENPGGLAVQSTAQIINSDAPNWSTDASLGSYEEGESVNVQLLAYDDDSTAVTGYTLQSGSLPSGITLSGDSTIGSLSGTAPTVSADTAYNFTIRATDNESQTTDKAFNMTIADYNISNTLLFNDDDSAYLQWTPSGAGNRRTFTYSIWFKRGTFPSNEQYLFEVNETANNDDNFRILLNTAGSTQNVLIQDTEANVSNLDLRSNQLLRDPSAWYHLVIAVDTTDATSSNRCKVYLNGSQITSWSTSNYPTQNYDTNVNVASEPFAIGKRNSGGSGSYFDGYVGETIFVDGQQLAATSFGETNSDGVWIPKKYTGSYGTNGFLLEFDSSGSLGTDTSGNGNNFTANNFAATDQMQDSPHLNYATLNPLTNSEMTFSEGNLKTVRGGTNGQFATSTFETNAGKWYFESKLLNYSGNSRPTIGIAQSSNSFSGTLAGHSGNKAYYLLETSYYQSNSATGITVNTSPATNDIYMWAIDLDNLKFYIGKNGTWYHSSNPSTNTNGLTIQSADYYAIATGPNDNGTDTTRNNEWIFNFGSPVYSISSGNADGDGYGNFEYSVPTGFYALNSKNLATYG